MQEDSSSGLSNWKRDGSPTPNDLFWANRGKKSMGAGSAAVHSPHQQGQFWPKPHSFMGPIFKAQGQRRSSSAGLQNAFNSMRPNSFMNMYQSLQPKRSSITEQQQRMAALKNLRPNSFLFPSLSGQQVNQFISKYSSKVGLNLNTSSKLLRHF